MDCYLFVLFGLLGLLCCRANREHDKKVHSHVHAHRFAGHKRISASLHKQSHENDEVKPHKKEEMLGQDMMQINEAEFKLQSLVSPEFHQGSHALHRGKVFGNMEVNTMSPEQVDFVQATSQWPKFSEPGQRNNKELAKTIYPEDPVLFPNRIQPQRSNDNTNLVPMGNTFKSMTGSQFDDEVPVTMDGSNMNMNSINAMFQGQSQQKSNNMQYDIKPGYTTTADAPVDDKFPPFSNQMGAAINVQAKAPLGFRRGGTKENNMPVSLFNEGIINRHGKPLGILGKILKASQEMPSAGNLVRASERSGVWNAGPFSRRHKLERSEQSGVLHKLSSSFKRTSKQQKKKSKNKQ